MQVKSNQLIAGASIRHLLNEAPIFLTDLLRFRERPRPFTLHASKVVLNICDVVLEILSDKVFIFTRGGRIARYKWSGRCQTRLGLRRMGHKNKPHYNSVCLFLRLRHDACPPKILGKIHPAA